MKTVISEETEHETRKVPCHKSRMGSKSHQRGEKKHGGNSMVLSLEFFDVIFPWQREVAENEKAVYS